MTVTFLNAKTAIRIFVLTLLLSAFLFGQVRLPKLISDGMVLQRDTKLKVWGWAEKGENISVNFINNTYKTTADAEGDWSVTLPELKAGGPYTMQIKGSNEITINNILIGDVWLCSGQSNMEHTVGSFSWVYKKEIANSTNNYIREFHVPPQFDFNEPQKDFQSGSWKEANPENVLDFSAVAYFFGKEIYDKYKVPIGLINSSLGGSPIESWISEEALKSFPAYYNEARIFRDSLLIKEIQESDSRRIGAWYNLSTVIDKEYKNREDILTSPTFDTSDWLTMTIPGYWADTKIGPINGVLWFRKTVNIPKSMVGEKAKILLGRIVDADSVFINGKYVGNTTYLYPRRRYDIPPNVLKEGENIVVIRVINNTGIGGFVLDKPYEIDTDKDTVDLKGDWIFKVGDIMPSLASQTFIRWKPLGLYNAMIAPLLNYKIRGAVWYQGESNADRPIEYRKLFPAMINDWREKWGEGNFPFLFVQLPNFMEAKSEPSESNWALLREAQLMTLSLPETGMAVTIDIGEWNDIHPVDKKDVGNRLALAAEKIAYGENNIVCSGPIYKSMKVKVNKIILTFDYVGSGLMAKGGGSLKYFSIAGKDKKFIWAKAKIENNKVVVWSDKLTNPVAVRYAWADNPDGANLYNKEGLPASPFRTDDF
jgi:sialate O-acetylesterase